jgi:hypothetical protein
MRLLKQYDFEYPVCIDLKDSLNALNHFPPNESFHTFLLDRTNKVVAIGNPILNPQIKELYLKIISGEDTISIAKTQVQTNLQVDKEMIDFGTFPWQQEQVAEFTITNTGKEPLVLIDVTTSCGCTSVDFPKAPIPAGEKAVMKVTYKADQPEYFNKTITVYCNATGSPFQLKVRGNAK